VTFFFYFLSLPHFYNLCPFGRIPLTTPFPHLRCSCMLSSILPFGCRPPSRLAGADAHPWMNIFIRPLHAVFILPPVEAVSRFCFPRALCHFKAHPLSQSFFVLLSLCLRHSSFLVHSVSTRSRPPIFASSWPLISFFAVLSTPGHDGGVPSHPIRSLFSPTLLHSCSLIP